jgi:hypothetical protein
MKSVSRSPAPSYGRDRSPRPRGASDRDRESKDVRERSPPSHMCAGGGDRARATPPHMRDRGGRGRAYDRDRR